MVGANSGGYVAAVAGGNGNGGVAAAAHGAGHAGHAGHGHKNGGKFFHYYSKDPVVDVNDFTSLDNRRNKKRKKVEG
ncbi:unnamed protein product [Ambrosiozyma monospora]|nr:unnamed protein product [Ambrosiozyma monospora]